MSPSTLSTADSLRSLALQLAALVQSGLGPEALLTSGGDDEGTCWGRGLGIQGKGQGDARMSGGQQWLDQCGQTAAALMRREWGPAPDILVGLVSGGCQRQAGYSTVLGLLYTYTDVCARHKRANIHIMLKGCCESYQTTSITWYSIMIIQSTALISHILTIHCVRHTATWLGVGLDQELESDLEDAVYDLTALATISVCLSAWGAEDAWLVRCLAPLVTRLGGGRPRGRGQGVPQVWSPRWVGVAG